MDPQLNEATLRRLQQLAASEGCSPDALLDRMMDAHQQQQPDSLLLRLFDSTLMRLAYMDADFNFLRVNEAYAGPSGQTPEAFVGLNHFDLYPDADNEALFRQVVQTGEPLTVQGQPFTFPGHPERGTTYWDWSLQPVVGADGRAVGLLLVLVDVTERYLAEAELRRSEERYRMLVENQTDMVVKVDTENRFTFVSPSYCRTFGKSEDELLGQTFVPLIHEDDRASTVDAMKALYQPPYIVRIEQRAMTVNGWRWLAWVDTAVLDAQGNVIEIIGVARDITERKQAEAAVEASREALHRLVHQIPVGIQVFDVDGLCTDANPAHLAIFGVTREQIVGRYNIFADPLAAAMLTQDAARRALRGELVRLGDLEFHFEQGDARFTATEQEPRTVNVTIVPIVDENQYVTGFVGVNVDMTEREQSQRREFELALERERMHLLSTFVRDATHEFRTPLSTIGTSAYLMARSDDAAKRQAKADQIEGQIQQINKLVDMLLVMVRLESEEPTAAEAIDIRMMLNGVYENMRYQYELLCCHIDRDLPQVMGHPDLLAEALHQIIDNACRFTPAGGSVTLTVGVQDRSVWIAVRDTGPGIAPDDLPHVFETFWRDDSAHTTPGFGLGLPIARRIIEAHGGTITIDSAVGQGTNVRVYLPTSP